MSYITVEEATKMIAKYKSERPNILKEGLSTNILPLNITLPKSEVSALISQQGCISLRVYFGMQVSETKENDNLIDVILVAADENNNDIIPEEDYILLDRGVRCPPQCPPESPINP